jgi:hypothetical protein
MATKDLQAAPASLHDVMGQVAAEVAAPLTRALERIRALQSHASADAEQLRALHDEVAHARHVGILGQQIARLASGTVRQVLEPVDLHGMLRELLDEQRREAPSARLREKLEAATIVADSGLVGALMRSVVDWCSQSAASPIDLMLQARPATMQAVLSCRFMRHPAASDNGEPLSWHLMHFAAAPLGARLELENGSEHATLRITIDRLVPPALPGRASAADIRLLAGCQLLVVSNDRDIRHQVRCAVQGLDLLVDYVTSVDAASEYCDEGLPQAVVYASTLAGTSMARLRNRLGQVAGGPPFIEISPAHEGYEPPAAGERSVRRVVIDELAQALPAALVIEMTRRR